MRKGPGRRDTWFRVICMWNLLLKVAAVIGFSFKERFLRFQLLFPDFYHFHHVIWRMELAKKLKTKNGQNMSSGPFSRYADQFTIFWRKRYAFVTSTQNHRNFVGFIVAFLPSSSLLRSNFKDDSCLELYLNKTKNFFFSCKMFVRF